MYRWVSLPPEPPSGCRSPPRMQIPSQDADPPAHVTCGTCWKSIRLWKKWNTCVKVLRWTNSNYIETFKDCIRMTLIFTDFHQINYIITRSKHFKWHQEICKYQCQQFHLSNIYLCINLRIQSQKGNSDSGSSFYNHSCLAADYCLIKCSDELLARLCLP